AHDPDRRAGCDPRFRALPGGDPDRPRGGPGPERHEADLRDPGGDRPDRAAGTLLQAPTPEEGGRLGASRRRGPHRRRRSRRRDHHDRERGALMLTVSSVDKTFFPGTANERRALTEVDLHLEQGDFVTVIGSNGAGKSTLLNIISGDLAPDDGTVTIAGRDVTRLKDHQRASFVGRVFQDPMAGTAPHLS